MKLTTHLHVALGLEYGFMMWCFDTGASLTLLMLICRIKCMPSYSAIWVYVFL